MCLISFHWQPGSATPLTMTANRDEFHARPARPAQFWPEHPELLAGQDLEAGGTWMGVTREGRFAALTNVRQLPAPYEGEISRGNLVKDFLTSNLAPETYLAQVHMNRLKYDGFNLVLGNRQECWYLNNRTEQAAIQLQPGLYGLSNAQLDSPWPKLEFAKGALSQWLKGLDSGSPNTELATLLNRREPYPVNLLPNTGIGETWEHLLSPPFIVSPQYGTRASTGLQIHQQEIEFKEVTMDAQGTAVNDVYFRF